MPYLKALADFREKVRQVSMEKKGQNISIPMAGNFCSIFGFQFLAYIQDCCGAREAKHHIRITLSSACLPCFAFDGATCVLQNTSKNKTCRKLSTRKNHAVQ